MSVAALATDREEDPPRPGLQFDPRCYYERVPDGERENGKKQIEWKVEAAPAGDVITRKVCRNGAPWNQCGSTLEPAGCNAFTEDLVIWPTWPARSAR